jgi:UDP:flavonoid glycosyltransferase YjiC (YdhE family)
MRITIITVGKRGDVQPCVSLGVALQQRGHSVRIASNDTCEGFIRAANAEFFPVAGNPIVDIAWSGRQMKSSIDPAHLRPGRSAMLSATNVLRQRASGQRLYEERMAEHLRTCFEAARGSDAIVFSLPGIFGGYSVAEKLGVPCFAAYTDPIHPTQSFPHPLLNLPFGRITNRLTYQVARRVFWQLHGAVANRTRAGVLGLPPVGRGGFHAELDRRRCPVLYAYSPSVLPQPADWPAWIHTTGYWWLDCASEWTPPARLAGFLSSGPPPVYVGFGSVRVNPGGWDKHNAPDPMMQTIVGAAVKSRQRAVVLASGHADEVTGLPDNVCLIDPVPFDWLYPRMAATVHHGGAGTAGAAFRAGVPSAVVPFTAFQPFWGRRVAELGVGPHPVKPEDLTQDVLADILSVLTRNEPMRRNAAELGEKVRAENGVARAVDVLESTVWLAARAGA